MLKSSGVRATLSFNPLHTRFVMRALAGRISHGHHRVRWLTNYAILQTGHAYGTNGSTDRHPLQQDHQENGIRTDTSLLAKELQAQWHGKLNQHLVGVLIKPYSGRKAWWSCDRCPQGFPHVWEASVSTRSQGTGCPYCSGQKICQHNALATKAPQVALFWDATKNHPLSPEQVTIGSSMRSHWKCNACLHEWQTSVRSKVCAKTGCPKCAKAHVGKKADGTRQKHPTFTTAKHPLLEQWDHDKNSENGNSPDNTTLQSGKHIWWCCHECPQGKVHSWQALSYSRTWQGRKARGCPFCAGNQLCDCNSLETVCPDIAADFDTEKNGVSPAEVTSSTSIKYSWLSDEPGAKKRSVAMRTHHTKRCHRLAGRP
ncbi:TPA: hypothetical protein ACH3X2_013564 [Trebouxia sp. C0005]